MRELPLQIPVTKRLQPAASLRCPFPASEIATDEQAVVCVKVQEASLRTLTLAVLEGSTVPMVAAEINRIVRSLRPSTPSNSVYNLLRHIGVNGLAYFAAGGWSIARGRSVVSFQGQYISGPPHHLMAQDLAANRREVVLFLLKQQPGLRVMQITRCLSGLAWLQAPVNKNLIQCDLEDLRKRELAIRLNPSKQWYVFQSVSSNT